MSATATTVEPWQVAGRAAQGQEVRGAVSHLGGTRLVFETGDPHLTLRLSEVLDPLRLFINGKELNAGRAVVTSAVHNGNTWVCEVTLAENWFEGKLTVPPTGAEQPLNFEEFLRQWQKLYALRPEYKVVLSDLHSLLTHLRLWLEEVELGLKSLPPAARAQRMQAIIENLDAPVVQSVNVLHERFEEITARLTPEEHPAHQSLCRRLLHPLFLCSPFGHRTYVKPLGYAGDYEMVNMIMRPPYEGPSLYAQAVNVWLLRQYPSQAHRNRIRFLTEKLVQETARVSLQHRCARIFNLGCGPAHEIQNFLRESALSDWAEFTLLDFNQETIQHAQQVLEKARQEHQRQCRLQLVKKSVMSLLKEAGKSGAAEAGGGYDLVYCAGLFDYLPDRTCQQLMNLFYQWLAPGGLLVATNVFPCQPFRHMLEYLLDWRLIYRDPKQMLALKPAAAPPEAARVVSDLTGTNLMLEVRKPAP
ncbi:MAG: class I SAM-dependent methyltransferase [Verrucomicrobiae bacterium]|nr:class I SAM-dependent methyltransferase [Verrucomicrobiae bacterium]